MSPLTLGSPTINTEIVFDRAGLSLTCTSTGGPASGVVWTRNRQSIGSSYTQTQTITNTMESTYDNVLWANDVSDLVGEFTCTVTNDRGMDSRSIMLNGKYIVFFLFYFFSNWDENCSKVTSQLNEILVCC